MNSENKNETLEEVSFLNRHIGPSPSDEKKMLASLKFSSLGELIKKIIPADILLDKDICDFPKPLSESEALELARSLSEENKLAKNFLGEGYFGCHMPAVLRRTVFENPAWYTPYTPYQPELAQGRLEALFNFQTLVTELTGLAVANASLLDEATAAAEAMTMSRSFYDSKREKSFLVSDKCHPATIDVLKGRARAQNIEVVFADPFQVSSFKDFFGLLLACPDTEGSVRDLSQLSQKLKEDKTAFIVISDPLSLVLLKEPARVGADIVVGSLQRFGVPLGFGGPHAAFFACKESFKRKLPGRVVGLSQDKSGKKAFRLALQTREQHIRREKATSNICTAQALLANIASFYAVYHGAKGLQIIARKVHKQAKYLAEEFESYGFKIFHQSFFDSLKVRPPQAITTKKFYSEALKNKINLRVFADDSLGISLDETTSFEDLKSLLKICTVLGLKKSLSENNNIFSLEDKLLRKSSFLNQKVFSSHHSETNFARYVRSLEEKDLSLLHSMIPLGSCTMKLNAACELEPLSYAGLSALHPYVPKDQCLGYLKLISETESLLAKLTGFAAISLQPNSGAQGELAGLAVIKAYLQSKGEDQRKICLIPSSAHGTNPASAVMAGFEVKVISCDEKGNIDLVDLKNKTTESRDKLACLMMTYPSTHGVFEKEVRSICSLIHAAGGQVYMDGANLNAQVGLCQPASYGVDVAHLNLHKTFCIPHGGGGPGVGPIGVSSHLKDFLPTHVKVDLKHKKGIEAVAGAPYGSASILPVSWLYMRLMGSQGLKKASQIAILNANYMAKKLSCDFPILYTGETGFVAHECIIDLRHFQKTAGVTVADIAKRLMDYGFHAPTVSWPVAGTMMIEPTESESLSELDLFCEAMKSIRLEIKEIEEEKVGRDNNLLKNAPHPVESLCSEWNYPYSRERAVYPLSSLKEKKFWPSVSRIDEAFGDRNFCCTL